MLTFTDNPGGELRRLVGEMNPSGVFLLGDANTAMCVIPRLLSESGLRDDTFVITTPEGDENKNLAALEGVWKELGRLRATRSSLLVNVGGGVVTDLGGFAAATFKRGIPFVNLPTTLLGAVDASTGGKTGINFGGLKNEIGTFRNAEATIISTRYFDTLAPHQLLDGYAEMLKHGLITSAEMTARLLNYDVAAYSDATLLPLLRESVGVKQRFVEIDPFDKGPRHALNLGHTFAHAFESLAMSRHKPVSHGYAVAWGLVAALIMSHLELGMPTAWLNRVAPFVRENYGHFPFSCREHDTLIGYMLHDKKNTTASAVNFTLLRDAGTPVPSVAVPPARISATLDIFADTLC